MPGILISEMKKIYQEFGMDIHSLNFTQTQVNELIKEIIKLRKKEK